MKISMTHPGMERAVKVILVIFSGILIGTWLSFTPGGLLGKADAVGYAVCHRIAVRSFLIGDRQFPLCARCSGMYLGALLGFLFQIPMGRKGALPNLKIKIALGVFFVAFGIDGVNSYAHFFPSLPNLYEPQNWLRLLTGTGVGLGIAAVLLPTFHQTIWSDWVDLPALYSWKQFGLLVGLAILLDAAVLSNNPLILYPLGLLSAATILAILSMIYAIIWGYIIKKENQYRTLKQLSFLLLAGFTTALLQVAVMDAARFALTRTWGGFL